MKTILLFNFLLFSLTLAQNSNIKQGDFHYSLRAEKSWENTAKDKNVKEAIKHYNLALEDSSSRQEAAWKLLRAYYFLGCFAVFDSKERQVLFDKARKEGKVFYNEFPKNPDIAYWYSVNLALWIGSLSRVVALTHSWAINETRNIALMLMACENTNKAAAARGYQILGTSHQKLPRIAVFLNWVSKDSVEFYYKKSLALNPEDFATSLFLAEFYKERGRKEEAENLLLPIIKKKYRAEQFLEDERNIIKMRKLLE